MVRQRQRLSEKYIVKFTEVDKSDVPLVGGKGANLGEMTQAKFPVPPGFIVTTRAYKQFLTANDLQRRMEQILREVDIASPRKLQQAAEGVVKLFNHGLVPPQAAKEIIASYRRLGGLFNKKLVAVRSSATAEDLPTASFAGQQITFLNIRGEANVVESVRKCWASLFTARAIFYRAQQKIPTDKVSMAVVVQEMVQSEISGVAFTVDPVTGAKNTMLIEAIWGLGELIVQGSVVPDRYRVARDSLKILSTEVAEQTVELTRQGIKTTECQVPASRGKKRKLNDEKLHRLGTILRSLHQHYYFPQDVEWAYVKEKFYIVQTRPVTTLKSETPNPKQQKISNLILKGVSASPGMATGRVVHVKSSRELNKIKGGDVLVTKMTSPDFVPAMRRAVAIVTDLGGQTSHAAIVSRELGIPCVVGTKNATAFLHEGLIITVDGTRGMVYKGGVRTLGAKSQAVDQSPAQNFIGEGAMAKTVTKIYVNLAEPDKAGEMAGRNVDGVGLFRAEFMMAEIGVHPKRAIKDGKAKEYVARLAGRMAQMCEAFYPRPVVYRTTDFKTNEYRNLKGGDKFEPVEANPLLGYRGAFRYVADPDVFELELRAIKKIREDGLKNLWVMIPFVRSPKELRDVKAILYQAGIVRGPTLKLWLMVELPVNVILLDEFLRVGIDGVSIGSNDLTMLILGTDRDNAEVAPAFSEISPAVLWALEKVVKQCAKVGVTASICGQAPSVYDSLVRLLVRWGITSISVNPDAIERVRQVVYSAEQSLVTNSKK